MGRLIQFELRKALKSKFFLIVFCLAVLVSFLLQCGIPVYQDYVQGVKEYDPTLPVETFFEYMDGHRRVSRLWKEEAASYSAIPEEEHIRITAALKEKYGEDVLTNYFFIDSEEIRQAPGCSGTLADFDYLSVAEYLHSLNTDAEEQVNTVLRSAEAFLKEAQTAGDIYGVRRNEEILRLYSMPREKITTYICHTGDAFLNTPSMLFVCLFVLLTAAASVAGEHDRRTWLLLHTARNGKEKNLLAKYISGWLIGAGLTVTFQAVSIAALYFQGGIVGADQPVTIIDELVLCPWPIRVWQYALLSLACQVFTAVIFSTLLTTVSAFSKNGVIAYGIGSLILGGCLLLLYFPPKTEWLAGPLALAEPCKYFARYHVCNLFGVPVLWAAIHGVVWTFCAAALILIAAGVYCRKRRVV